MANEQAKARLQEQYENELRPQLMEQFGLKNVLAAPKLEKIVLNMGIGEAVSDSKKVNAAVEEMTKIAGQQPVVTRAKKSIATLTAIRMKSLISTAG